MICLSRFRVNLHHSRLCSNSALRFRNLSTVNSLQSTDLLDVYQGLAARGEIQSDEEQIRVIMQLRSLRKDLVDYVPSPTLLPHSSKKPPDLSLGDDPWWIVKPDELATTDTKSIVRIQTHAEALANLDTPKGLLLIGLAGAGKSFLLQLFYDSLPTPYKARKHYSQLVLEIYRGVWEESKRRSVSAPDLRDPVQPVRWDKALRERWRQLLHTGTFGSEAQRYQGVEPSIAYAIARRLIVHHWLLFFDEIQLLDVSSAGLLSDVLSWYWRMGGVVIGSGNKVPDDLYRGGVQRERLEPFVEALKARCPVLVMREEKDWRRVKAQAAESSTWFVRGSDGGAQKFDEAVKEVAKGRRGVHATMNVFGRPLRVPWTASGIAQFPFSALCEQELGPADYLSIASTFHTIIVTDIPIFPLSKKNEARRFISLLDALYECRCRLISLAAAKPDDVFFPDTSSSEIPPPSAPSHEEMMMAEAFSEGQQQAMEGFRPNVASYDTDLGRPTRRDTPSASSMTDRPLSIFTGEEERFAYARAVSRIHELSSASHNTASWAPLTPATRQWETLAGPTAEYSASSSTPPKASMETNNDDFASEAAYQSPNRRMRVEAPKIAEAHIWGAREDWGPKAGDWGKGAKMFEGKDEEGKR